MVKSDCECELLVVGGGLGGCAAALAALEAGRRVVLTEPTDWIGGQVSQQGVPPDENRWIESCGAARSYARYRSLVRGYYREHFPLTRSAFEDACLNPGGAWVSRIGHLPWVSVAVLQAMLARYVASGRLRLWHEVEPTGAEVDGDAVRAVTFRQVNGGEPFVVQAKFVIDASECGDLLPLAGCEYVTGFESQSEHGEPHAPAAAQPTNMQAVTWCFAMDCAAGDHVIDRPSDYDHWREYVPAVTPAWPGRMLSWVYSNPRTLEPCKGTVEAGERGGEAGVRLWEYRQVLDPRIFDPAMRTGLDEVADALHPGITIVNWPQNDYIVGPVFECKDAAHHMRQAKRLSLSLFYWMQTEAPRSDGGVGYPNLRLRPDVMGTCDGFAKRPYIREARRIRAQLTVTENHVARHARGSDAEAARFDDSVGIGAYHLDLHPSTGGDNYIDMPSYPFQIPLRALVPVRLRNLLPAAKNIGTTHIANGCYRLHPVEWSIGEAAGQLAAMCVDEGVSPQAVAASAERVEALQRALTARGVPLDWPAIRVPG
ncbi:FAD-dependent oxidoreductase [Phycisphaerales bacterium AB-hyl4]|uniref:FAD-dependent oxidoreductase n=1 Tax=Natronomicrosphaera hydrolytica TaxID=3242702 RepID=A0ABV4U923_9BACT